MPERLIGYRADELLGMFVICDLEERLPVPLPSGNLVFIDVCAIDWIDVLEVALGGDSSLDLFDRVGGDEESEAPDLGDLLIQNRMMIGDPEGWLREQLKKRDLPDYLLYYYEVCGNEQGEKRLLMADPDTMEILDALARVNDTRLQITRIMPKLLLQSLVETLAQIELPDEAADSYEPPDPNACPF